MADYLRFLAFSGAREQEALRIKWAEVDFERERVTIGADRLTKNWESRTVEFNPQLGALLRDMRARRAPDCAWLFPSPRRGPRDEHARSFRESLKMARKGAGLEWVGFHDLRHYFCSVCVMAGIDFMTIAAWLGHKDGGILVGNLRALAGRTSEQSRQARPFWLAPVARPTPEPEENRCKRSTRAPWPCRLFSELASGGALVEPGNFKRVK